MYKYFAALVFLCLASYAVAQPDLGFGFRAGLNFSKITGPSELSPNNEELEDNRMTAGFHIGMAVSLKFTDLVGLRAEAVYTQRGTDYFYEGPSYLTLGRNTLQPVTLLGERRQNVKVSNSYIDIPLLAYYKIGYFELYGGLNTGFLIASSAGGEIVFEGTSPIGNPVTPFELGLDYNYKKDKAGEASTATKDVTVDGRVYTVPQFLGAYYDYPVKDQDLYETLDFGLVFGASYFLNEGLYISARYIHGLNDVDRNFYDRSLQALDSSGSFVQRADTNKSRSWQFSVGFSF